MVVLVSEAAVAKTRKGVPLRINELEGRVEVYLHNLPVGVTAVTIPRPGADGPRPPRDRKQRLNPKEVDLIPASPVPAFEPPHGLSKRDLIKVLQTGSYKKWATVEAEFGERAWSLAVALIRAGAIALRCDVVNRLDYRPNSWRLSASWAEVAGDLLEELQDKPDPDQLRATLVDLMAEIPELASERAQLAAQTVGTPLVVPRNTAVKTDRWTVYEAAVRAACTWWPYQGTDRRLTAKELAALAFRSSKAWTTARRQGFTNLIGVPFDQAVDESDTEVRLCGPLVWYVRGVAADASRSRPWVSLPANGLRLFGEVECTAIGIFLLENEDTFQRVCETTQLSERWLCIWGEGYASPGLTALLRALPALPIAVWGDLDAHGIQIITDLISRVGRHIHPVNMDAQSYIDGIKYKQDEKKRAENLALAKRMCREAPAELRPLAQAIVEHSGDGCEQETLYELIRELPGLLEQLEPSSQTRPHA